LLGALAFIKAEETRGTAHIGYRLLSDLLREIARFPFLPYDRAAEQIYHSYPAAIRRLGSADCKIAAVAQARGAIVITRNARHFSAIPGVTWEDWTQSIF
jgi:tRNA(fMet)-specific endonuclease VapC